MAFNTFGYNALFEIRKEILDKLLAQVWERNMVHTAGSPPNDEFLTIAFPLDGGGKAVIYLKHGVPVCGFEPAVKNANTIRLRVPLEVAIFTAMPAVAGGAWQHTVAPKVDVEVSPVTMVKTISNGESVVAPDFTALTGDGIHLYLPGGSVEMPNEGLDQILTGFNVPLTAAALKERIAGELKSGKLSNVKVTIPDAGLQMEMVKEWDFRVVPKPAAADGYDGLDLMLYEAPNKGAGVAGDAGNTIPTDAAPPHSFSIALGQNVIQRYFDAGMEDSGFYTQGGTINTPSNPRGYMVVSSKNAAATYTLPPAEGGSPNGKVTIAPPQNGTVAITVAPGGLTQHSRVEVTNLSTGAVQPAAAGNDGGLSVTLPAAAGDKIALSVRAMTFAADRSLVIWRPKLALHDGEMRMSFHYYKYFDNWCDAQGDGWVDAALEVDRSAPFKLTPRVVDSDIDLPWWAHVLGILIGIVSGGLLDIIQASILVEALAPVLVDSLVSSKLNGVVEQQFKFPSISSRALALFLESVEVRPQGIKLTGRADAGAITAYGRQRLKVAGKTKMTKPHVMFLTPTGSGSVKVGGFDPCAGVTDANASVKFWQSGYDQGDALTYSRSEVEVASGQPAIVWFESSDGITKALVEWDAATGEALVSSVCFADRVTPSLEIVNRVEAIQAVFHQSPILMVTRFRYEGWLELATEKFFSTQITREAGLEQWTCNGIALAPGVSNIIDGVSVAWDIAADRVNVLYDPGEAQQLLPKGEPVPRLQFKFEGQDAFGLKMSAAMELSFPSGSVDSIQPDYDNGVRHDYLPDPPWATHALPWLDLHAARRSRQPDAIPADAATLLLDSLGQLGAGQMAAQRAVEALSRAFRHGAAPIGRQEAKLLMGALAKRTGKGAGTA